MALSRLFPKEDIHVHNKGLSINNYQRNVNKNHNEILPHTVRMTIIKMTGDNKQQALASSHDSTSQFLKITFSLSLCFPLLSLPFSPPLSLSLSPSPYICFHCQPHRTCIQEFSKREERGLEKGELERRDKGETSPSLPSPLKKITSQGSENTLSLNQVQDWIITWNWIS